MNTTPMVGIKFNKNRNNRLSSDAGETPRQQFDVGKHINKRFSYFPIFGFSLASPKTSSALPARLSEAFGDANENPKMGK